ncbi:hypothetical protein [Streptomyces shenzhenensis]|uniref:hypothetical protein n=1 Tax=Streptomyces shenzhenensis TaxID=943815 RepID=UPI0036A14DF9
MHRLLDHYLHSAHAADRMLAPHRNPIALGPPHPADTAKEPTDGGQALMWFTTKHAVLLAAVEQAAGTAAPCLATRLDADRVSSASRPRA